MLYYYTGHYNGVISKAGLNIVGEIVKEIERFYPTRSLAIVSPFKDTVRQLQKTFLTDTAIEDLTVETIDRIQGMTVDYAIVYIPGRNIGFALEERRFNVATSRSKSTTLIISDVPLLNMPVITPHVAEFLRNSVSIGEDSSGITKSDVEIIEKIIDKNDVKALYPGLEDIVDMLLSHNIPFSHDGDVELTDDDGVVIATAGLLLRDFKIAIDPEDESSRRNFEANGYRAVSSQDFDISMLN